MPRCECVKCGANFGKDINALMQHVCVSQCQICDAEIPMDNNLCDDCNACIHQLADTLKQN